MSYGFGLAHATQNDVRMASTRAYSMKFKGPITALQIYDVALTAEQINEVKDN